jgi:SAM-dependent methyltransferase
VRSDVLDAGCGYAELSLALAAEGYTAHGVDLAPTAIAVATKAAADLGLRNASFEEADVTTFTGFEGLSTQPSTLTAGRAARWLYALDTCCRCASAAYYVLVLARAPSRRI